MTELCPELTLSTTLPKRADAVLLGMATINQDEPALVGLLPALDKACQKAYGTNVAAMADAMGAAAKEGSVVALPAVDGTRIFVVGLGSADVTPDGVRTAAGNGLRT
ncbi:M17 family peptidase N-terminal domain-containing protein, partial [Tessaracoccus lubricantis]